MKSLVKLLGLCLIFFAAFFWVKQVSAQCCYWTTVRCDTGMVDVYGYPIYGNCPVCNPIPCPSGSCEPYCTGSCGVCPAGSYCTAYGPGMDVCVDYPSTASPPPAGYCGDGVCGGTETCLSCPTDCGICTGPTPTPGPFCGDGVCNNGEVCNGCIADCGTCSTNPPPPGSSPTPTPVSTPPPPPPPPPPTLSVNLQPNPATGTAPLNSVAFTVTVGGTATGDIRYQIDCTSDGTYELDQTTSSNPLTTGALCNYASAGLYYASVFVTRQGVGATDYALINVSAVGVPTVSVNLTASPTSGTAPLNGVDLTASVGGTATGDIRYQIDCQTDGIYEVDVTNTTNPYTALGACNYTVAGVYTATVLATRQGVTAFDSTNIDVVSGGQCALPVVYSPVIVP